MAKSTPFVARKRHRAREAGLCVTCCREKPKMGRVTCVACNASALERNKRKRERGRVTIGPKQIVEAHERAGDVAREHDFHAAAARHYQDALSSAASMPDDYDRISGKLTHALFFGGKPDMANPLYERLLTSYLATPGNAEKAVTVMLKIARQRWVDAKTPEALPIVAQAMQLAEKTGERHLWMRLNLSMHKYCVILGRYSEATQLLRRVGKVGIKDPPELRIAYYKVLAIESIISGKASKTYQYFERVLSIMGDDKTPYHAAALWNDYSYCAMVLGDTNLAKSCAERALLIARQYCIAWIIPFLCLEYAKILALLGQQNAAYGYLLEALSSGSQTPVLERALAENIPLALRLGDKGTLAKCAQPAVLMRVFQSNEPESINVVSAAFAKLYAAQGNKKEAQALLHRAVEAICPVPYGLDLPLEVARQGASADISRARMLLEARSTLPHSRVAHACLELFDAYIAHRENNLSLSHQHAKEAVKRFETLDWHAYADEARSLLPGEQHIARAEPTHSLPFSDLQAVLTPREQEVANFVLQGLTNRAIATELSVTENTVEKHMTAIMTRLGIRSRHQLAGAVEGAPSSPDSP